MKHSIQLTGPNGATAYLSHQGKASFAPATAKKYLAEWLQCNPGGVARIKNQFGESIGKTPPPVMSEDAKNFLETLLWVADSPDHKRRPFQNSTVYDFTAPFVAGVESFITGFRAFLEAREFDIDRLDGLARSFGGNVFFSLSGHGCGFYEETGRNAHPGNYPDGDEELGDELHALVTEYGGDYRFEELESRIMKARNGKISLSILPQHLDAAIGRMFTVA